MICKRFNSSACIDRMSHNIRPRTLKPGPHIVKPPPSPKVVVLKRTITGQEVFEEIEIEEDLNPNFNNFVIQMIHVVTLMHMFIS